MDLMNYTIILSDGDKSVIVGGQHADETTAAGEGGDSTTQQSTPSGQSGGLFGGWGFWVVVIVVYVAALYFFGMRPNKQREKKLKELQQSLKVGDSVITSTGFYGKIVDVGDDVFVVEFGTNKGVRIPVSKEEILGQKEPKLTTKAVVEKE